MKKVMVQTLKQFHGCHSKNFHLSVTKLFEVVSDHALTQYIWLSYDLLKWKIYTASVIVYSKQTVLFYYIYMYRGFADAEFPGRRAHRGPVFYQVKGQLTGPFLHVPFDSAPLLSHTMHHHYMPGFPAAELRLFPCHGSRILV